MRSNVFAANVDKMGTSVPKLPCTVLYTLTHLITATTRVQNVVKCREILFRIYTNNENKQDKTAWSRSCIY